MIWPNVLAAFGSVWLARREMPGRLRITYQLAPSLDCSTVAEPAAIVCVPRDSAGVIASTVPVLDVLESDVDDLVPALGPQDATRIAHETGYVFLPQPALQCRMEYAYCCSWAHLPWEDHLIGIGRLVPEVRLWMLTSYGGRIFTFESQAGEIVNRSRRAPEWLFSPLFNI
jgi:hypothetical protein